MPGAVFALPSVRWLAAALVSAGCAIQVQAVAIGWHLFTLHHRALDLGLVGLALFLPTLIFVFPAGMLADHYDRRAIAIVATALDMLCSLGFVALIAGHVISSAPYFAIIVVIGVARAFGVPAKRGMLINIVERDQYLATSAAYSSFQQFTNIAGPALGGALILAGTVNAFLATAVLFGFAVLCYIPLRLRNNASPSEPPSLRGALEALRFLREQPVVLGAITLDVCAVFFGGSIALFPVYADTILGVGPVGLGCLRSAIAVGAGVMGVYLARRPPQHDIGRNLLVTVAVFGIANLAFAFSRSFALSLITCAAMGISDMLSVVIRNGLVQLNTPDAIRGRVMAVENVFISTSNELGAFESGGLAQLMGTVPAVAVGGVATLLIVASWPFLFPAVHRARRLNV